MLNRVKSVVVRLHRDDSGMEAIQIVMTLAIAAMVCLGVAKVTGVGSADVDGNSIIGVILDKASQFLGSGIKTLFGTKPA